MDAQRRPPSGDWQCRWRGYGPSGAECAEALACLVDSHVADPPLRDHDRAWRIPDKAPSWAVSRCYRAELLSSSQRSQPMSRPGLRLPSEHISGQDSCGQTCLSSPALHPARVPTPRPRSLS